MQTDDPMSVWNGLRGHVEVREAFARAAARGRLTQAYLFLGPEGIGKRQFARRLAQCLLCERDADTDLEACGECRCCRPFLAGTHPDFLMVERDPGKRELAVAKFIGDRDQRGKAGLCYELSIRPVGNGRKIAIIDDADTMTDEAANALLKTLEEPPDGVLLILIASNREAILPTIRSRCQSVRFAPLAASDLTALILEQELVTTEAEARSLATLSQGSLAVARQLSAPALRELRLRFLEELAKDRWDGVAVARVLAEGVDQIGSDVAEQRGLVLWLLHAAMEFYRTALWTLSRPDDPRGRVIEPAIGWTSRLSPDIDVAVDAISGLIDRIQLAAGHIEQNVSVALCLEALCTDLARVRSEVRQVVG